jgi:phosphoglycerate kinase
MAKKTVRDIDVVGKRVLVRVDFNVPLKEGVIKDDTRIRAALPTIIYLRSKAAKVVLASHLGRPKKQPREGLVMDPVAARLSQLLDAPVRKLDQLSGPEVEAAVAAMKAGEVILLENSRFDPREEKNDPTLAAELARLADVYVDDAFGTAHRAHATTEGVATLLPAVSGLLMEKELFALDTVVKAPGRPFAVVMGGAKVTDKIGVIDRFLDVADDILVGGAMCFTFFKAQGMAVGASLVEDEEGLAVARRALDKAAESHCDLHLPTDVVVATAADAGAETKVVPVTAIPDGWMGLDIGPETTAAYEAIIAKAGEIFWNGPMGMFELAPFAKGTEAVARAMASASGMSVVGGGDSVAAVNALGLAGQMDHVSTGGGASLEFIESGGILPGVTVLEDKPDDR